jgi:hypothetical protein
LPPARLRWSYSETTIADIVDPTSFTGRAASLLREFTEGRPEQPDEYWVRELAIPDTDIAQVQLAAAFRHHPSKGEEWNACEEYAEISQWTGRFRETGFEPLALGLDDEPWAEEIELVGAFVVDGEPRWLVFSAWMQALVVTPGAEPRMLVTGIHHDEVVASDGWSPVGGCEP